MSLEVKENVVKTVIDNWDNSGLAFFLAFCSALAFCFASIKSDDEISFFYQVYGISMLFLLMWKLPIYYVAEKKGISDKSSASLGITICFIILSALLIKVNGRNVFYYFGMGLTFLFSLLMVWRMVMKDSKVNVRKTFTISTIVLLAQCVGVAIILSEGKGKGDEIQYGIQLFLTSILLFSSIYRLIKFLKNRDAIENEIDLQSKV